MVAGENNRTEQALEPVAAVVAEVTEQLDWNTPAEVAAVLKLAPKLRSQLDAMQAIAMAAAERAGVHLSQDEEYGSVVKMMADQTGADASELRRLLRLGRWVADFDEFGSAWAAGGLLTEHVDVIRRTLVELFPHCEILFVTGGLGPTTDDITRAMVAESLGLELHQDPELLGWLKQRLRVRGIKWSSGKSPFSSCECSSR